MHPEVTATEPATCPQCGMKLVPADASPPALRSPREPTRRTTTAHDHGDGLEWEDLMPEINRATDASNMIWQLIDRETGAKNGDISWKFTVGDRVKIRLVNEMDSDHPMPHPFHVHGAGRFLVLSRDGETEPNLVWKDTVLLRSGETVDILLDVTNPGLWMAHCHIAEHIQSGMMFSFNVARRGPRRSLLLHAEGGGVMSAQHDAPLGRRRHRRKPDRSGRRLLSEAARPSLRAARRRARDRHVWKSRWDSLTLFTPAQYSGLPGMDFPAAHDVYPSKDEVVALPSVVCRGIRPPGAAGLPGHLPRPERARLPCGDGRRGLPGEPGRGDDGSVSDALRPSGGPGIWTLPSPRSTARSTEARPSSRRDRCSSWAAATPAIQIAAELAATRRGRSGDGHPHAGAASAPARPRPVLVAHPSRDHEGHASSRGSADGWRSATC